jgi:hypothetical protein
LTKASDDGGPPRPYRADAASRQPLDLPPDTPAWVRLTLEKMHADGRLLSEGELKAIFNDAAGEPEPVNWDKILTDELAELPWNEQDALDDPEPLPDD